MSQTPLNRREFARWTTLGVAAASLAHTSGSLSAEESEKSDNQPAENEEPKLPTEAELLLEVIRQRYPDERLTDELLKNVLGRLRRNISRSRTLSRFPLTNADEPAFHFAAFRDDSRS